MTPTEELLIPIIREEYAAVTNDHRVPLGEEWRAVEARVFKRFDGAVRPRTVLDSVRRVRDTR